MKRALLDTLPGRAIIVGLAIKVVVYVLNAALPRVPPFVGVVDTAAAIAVAAGGTYLLVRGVASATRRLLWRVRRKLIISYIFIGFVPAILIVVFFLLGGLLLFSNFSSYLIQTRLREFAGRAQSIAERTAHEIERVRLERHEIRDTDVAAILAGRLLAVSTEFPGASIAIARTSRHCDSTAADRGAQPVPALAAGPWAHAAPPATVPEWIDCRGYNGLFAYQSPEDQARHRNSTAQPLESESVAGIVARAVDFPAAVRPHYAVIVDLPIDEEARDELRRGTGVWLSGIAIVGRGVTPLPGRDGPVRVGASSTNRSTSWRQEINSVSFLQTHDWETGGSGELLATMQLDVRDIYTRLSAAQGTAGQNFRQGLLVALLVIGVLLLFIQFVALVAGLALARSITGAVHALFVGTERVRHGDFAHKIKVKTGDQLEELAESFNSMTASVEDLLRQAAEKKRLEEELRIAHEIQMSLLPQGPLHVPGLSVTAVCVPAREVGGDYYDFLRLDDNRVGLLIADVSGKGTSAALYMAELKGLLLSLSRIYTSPRALLIEANRLITEHLDARSFITMTYAVVDLRRHTMTYARAGHTPLIYVPGPTASTHEARILAPNGVVLGLKIDDGRLFERLLQEDTIRLAPGDVYLFFTDGISEAMNDRDDCFGEQRLGRLVEQHAHLPSEELRERVLREIAAFVGTVPQHDDMTMILLKVEPPESGAEPAVQVPATIGAGMVADG